MREISLDIESFCQRNLKTCGAYKYVNHKSFEILMFTYSIDDEPEVCVDLTRQVFPERVKEAILDDTVIKRAWNAQFERIGFSKYFRVKLSATSWRCTMIKSSMLGYPMSLDTAGIVLRTSTQKSSEGKALINYWCKPCKPTKANDYRTRNLPIHNPEKWDRFKAYNIDDVKTEKAVLKALNYYNAPARIHELYTLDQKINDYGVLTDMPLVRRIMTLDRERSQKALTESQQITNLSNSNSLPQLKKWIKQKTGVAVKKLDKENLPLLLKSITDEDVKRVLSIRMDLSKSSLAKYTAIDNMQINGILYGMFQSYGAGTGRFAGRGPQPHNLPRTKMKDIAWAREHAGSMTLEQLQMLYDVPDTFSQLIRPMFIPRPGKKFIISDFSAIEARILAWLAGETWRIEVFKTHGKIYEASAAKMLKKDIEDVTEEDRQQGKIGDLSLGYAGSAGAILRTPAGKALGMTEQEVKEYIVWPWRNANQNIVQLWKDLEFAAKEAIQGRPTAIQKGVGFKMVKGTLFMRLPSGRHLAYPRARIVEDEKGFKNICYEGINSLNKKWCLDKTYGGKLTENCVQGIAVDYLIEAMLQVDALDIRIPLHVHDEIVSEVDIADNISLQAIHKIMCSTPSWAIGLPMSAKTFESSFYTKD